MNQRKLRLAATVIAVLSLAIASWLYAIGQVKVLTLDARERGVVLACMGYGVAEGAWINGEAYCLFHQHRSQMYATMGGAEVWELEVVMAVPLADMPDFTGVMENK